MSINRTRRTFIKEATYLGLSVPLVMPGLARAQSPNGMVRHASFGADGMAGADVGNLSREKKFKLVAFCDVDERRMGNFKKRHPKAVAYTDYRKLLDKEHKNIDSVNVSTPDHMHGSIGLAAITLGKACYGQKPLGQNIFETRMLTKAAKAKGVVTQMGIQVHSSVYYRLAVELIHSGAIGKVKEVHSFSGKRWGDRSARPNRKDEVPAGFHWDLWLGCATERPFIGRGYYHPGNWRKRLDFGTGTFGDMGCHIYDPVFKALGVDAPTSVRSEGPAPGKHNLGNWEIDAKIHYVFPGSQFTLNPVKVTWYDGGQQPPKYVTDQLDGRKKPGQGSIFIGEKGVMLLPHVGRPYLLPNAKYAEFKYPRIKGNNHWGQFINAVAGDDKTSTHFGYSGPLTESVLLGGVATRFKNETLQWDAKALKFTNNKKANEFVAREYRKGHEIRNIA